MQTYLSLSKSDLEYNISSVTEYVKTPVIAVVKCNGYGIGIEAAVNLWYNVGVRYFAASEPNEVLRIADMGLDDIKILLLCPCNDAQTLKALVEHDIICTVTNPDCAKNLAAVGKAADITPHAHVKVNTGMGRFGTRFDDCESLLEIYKTEGILFDGIFSHFALSFENEKKTVSDQLQKFLSAVKTLEENGITVGMRHIANSCAALLYEDTRLDAVRIGSALIGRLMRKTPLDLKPVGVLKVKIADTIILKKGDTSGYAMLYKAKKDINYAVAECGYCYNFGMERQSDNFRFADLLRNILHAFKNHKKPLFMTDENGTRHNVVGRGGNQYVLIDNDDMSLKPGDTVNANVNLLFADSGIERVFE